MIPLNAYAGTGKTPAEIAARYRAHAAACVRFAQTVVPDIGGKLSLLDMAGRWLALAEKAEKNGDPVLVFETRPPQAERA
jgi:hypothetical protein